MNNRELERTINSNSLLKQHLITICPADGLPAKITSKLPGYIIVNSDPINQSGSHWLLCFINSRSPILFFDSYGQCPEFYNDSWRRIFQSWTRPLEPKVAAAMEPKVEQTARLERNSIQIQDYFSNTCGEHCLTVAHMLLRGHSLAYIVNNVYSPNDSCANDRFAVEYVNKICEVQ